MTTGFHLAKRLPLIRARRGSAWMRIHSQDRDALWFGPSPGTPPVNRFDDPAGEYRVCYFGTTLAACFAETFLRNPPVRLLAWSDLARRSMAVVSLSRDAMLVPAFGNNLAKLGVTAAIAASGDHSRSQRFARAVWGHGSRPDGIAYRSRHDDHALCVALFDRAKDGVALTGGRALTAEPAALASLLNRYDLGLTS